MNQNAFQKESTIKVKQTTSGKLHDSVGFSAGKGEGGYTQPLNEQLDAMKSNGFQVEKTPKGILITPKFHE